MDLTPERRERIADRRFLVTGGSGFIGSHVVDRLVAAGAREVVVMDQVVREDNLRGASASGRVRMETGDVTDIASVDRVMEGVDGVFHMAVLPLGPCTNDPHLCVAVNITGTLNVIDSAVRAGVPKVVFSSASSVYGDTLETTDESHPMAARTMYGASKLAGEAFLRAFKDMKGLDYVALRYMNVYGPRQEGGLIPSVLRRIRAGEAPVIMGDGSQSFDFVHVADVADINVHAMAADLTDDALNVGSGGEATVKEIVGMLIDITGTDLRPQHNTDAVVPMFRRVGTNDRAKEKLGWVPSIGLEEGLRDVVGWETAR